LPIRCVAQAGDALSNQAVILTNWPVVWP
jgi:hypothetical protein